MELVELPSIAQLSSRVTRVLGQNPGKFTLQGTNVYLFRQGILVDTGEGKEEFVPLLERALRKQPGQEPVSDIILTHWHKDHVLGLPSVLSLLARLRPSTSPAPRIHKYPSPTQDPSIHSILASLPSTHFTPGPSGPLHALRDLQLLPGGLRVLHTPGHTSDSVCLHAPEEEALLTADTVLGQGSAVFESLGEIMRSLGRLEGEVGDDRLWPGHGPVVEDGRAAIRAYREHRLERERQVVGVLLKHGAGESSVKVEEIVKVLYADTPQNLWPAAAHGVRLHLDKLRGEGNVVGEGDEWTLTESGQRAAL